MGVVDRVINTWCKLVCRLPSRPYLEEEETQITRRGSHNPGYSSCGCGAHYNARIHFRHTSPFSLATDLELCVISILR